MEGNLPNDPIQPNEPTQPHLSFDVPNTPEAAGIVLLDDAQAYLLTAGKWARFLGIMCYIGAGLMALIALFMGTIMSAVSSFSGSGGPKFAGLFAVIYLPIAVLYFFIGLYLYQFGTRVRDGVAFSNSAQVTEGLGKLKSLFKLLGIITIVALVLYAFMILIAIIAGAALFSGFKPSYQ